MVELSEKEKAFVETVKVRGRNVLVKRLEVVTERYQSKIILPQTRHEKNIFCEVLKLGDGELCRNGVRIPSTEAQVGDIVSVRQFAGQKVMRFFEDLLIVNGQEIEGKRSTEPWPGQIVSV